MIRTARTLLFTLPLCALPLGACSNQQTQDAADMAMEEADLRRMAGDLAAARCELPFDLRNIDKVTTGQVVVTPGAITTATIDATAGGFANFQSNPFVYLDLINGKRVDITDVQARDSKDWDIAFKRYVIKVNSGDSGPGQVTAAVVDGKALEEVTAAPGSGYGADHYFNKDCTVSLDSIGGLATAMSDWYDYDMNTMKLAPKKATYVLKRRDGKGTFKLQVMSYYNKDNVSANFTLRWSALP